MTFLDPFLTRIRELCQRHGVAELHVFGSVLSDDFGPESDVDFLVVFNRDASTNAFHQFFGFKEDLEFLLNRRVDLVCYQAIRNSAFKQAVERSKRAIYAA